MEKFKTSKQVFNTLAAGGYVFKFRLENGKDIYRNGEGLTAIVDFKKLTIDFKN